jgi:Amt family ammonium transporter
MAHNLYDTLGMKKMEVHMKRKKMLLLGIPLVLISALGYAQTEDLASLSQKVADLTKALAEKANQVDGNIIWTLFAAFLVFFMQAGFAMVETGFTRAKNAGNIIMKNLMDFSIGSLAYWFIGFGIMFGPTIGGIIGEPGFFFSGFLLKEDGTLNTWSFAFIIFQTVFAATAATIVSGAMAERTKFKSYLVYSFFVSAVIYPIFGSWAWGNLFKGAGWLSAMGFIDFAGSTVVHSIGGWIGLAGAIILGPRIGKYINKKPRAIPGHNIPMAALGVFILWFGWFGFNPGSTTTFGGSAAVIALTTNLAAASGALVALIVAWLKFKKADVGMSLNGALAGLVAITAGCANVNPLGAVIIGAIAGLLVVFSVLFFDKIGVDDPVGAVSVHGVNGAWGTIAVGLFADKNYGGINGLFYGGELKILGVQALGVATAFVFAFTLGFIMFKIIKATMGLRVSREEEVGGLDIHEHGTEAYANFRSTHN